MPQTQDEADSVYQKALATVERTLQPLDAGTCPPVEIQDVLLFEVFHRRLLVGASVESVRQVLSEPPFRLSKAAQLQRADSILAAVMLRFYRRRVYQWALAACRQRILAPIYAGWRRRGLSHEEAWEEIRLSQGGVDSDVLLAVSLAFGEQNRPSITDGVWTEDGLANGLARLHEVVLPRLKVYQKAHEIFGQSVQLRREDPSLGDVFDAALLAASAFQERLEEAETRERAARESLVALRQELEVLHRQHEQVCPELLPLRGKRIVVLADPPHAEDYLALLHALGAEAEFADAFAMTDRLAHSSMGGLSADAIIVCAAYCPHDLWQVLPRHVARFVVGVMGVGAFRRVVHERVLPQLCGRPVDCGSAPEDPTAQARSRLGSADVRTDERAARPGSPRPSAHPPSAQWKAAAAAHPAHERQYDGCP